MKLFINDNTNFKYKMQFYADYQSYIPD